MVVGSESEVDVLALADALEVGLLVVGDVVVADIQARQCPIGRKYIRGRTEGYSCTYLHLGRKAATIIAPEATSILSLMSALVMELSIVTSCLALPKVILDKDLRERERTKEWQVRATIFML